MRDRHKKAPGPHAFGAGQGTRRQAWEGLQVECYATETIVASHGLQSNRLPVLAAQIRLAHEGVIEAAQTAAERAIEAGHALIEAKALVKHGEWLPWLKQHVRISERSAQFYMKIAKLGLKSETVSFLGIKAASEAITLAYPDPFAEKSVADNREFALYMLFGIQGGYTLEAAEHSCHWLARNGWASPSEWLGETGDRYRAMWGMKRVAQTAKRVWSAYLAANEARTFEDLDAELRKIGGAP